MALQSVEIYTLLRAWEPSRTDPTLHAADHLYKWCAFVYLYRTVYSTSCLHAKLDLAVHEGIQCLAQIPPGSGIQSVLLFPLFVLGCAARNGNDRNEIRFHLERLRGWSRLGNIARTQEAVEKAWRNSDAALECDWEEFIEEIGSLNLLAT